MSESTSAPAADAPSAPAPASQPGISVSDAARLLGQQRRTAPAAAPAAQPAAPAPAAPDRKPSPNEMAAAAASPPPAPAPAAPAQSALERALGVPGESPPPAANTNQPGQIPANDTGLAIEIEGRRLNTIDDVREFARLKSADYTQKMQQLGTQRQQLDAQAQALQMVLPYIQPELQRLAESVNQQAQMPDPALAESDPAAYVRQRALYDQAIAEQQRLGGLTQLQQQAQARAMEQAVANANETLAKEYPFWADPAERATAQAQIVQWATTQGGFDRNELRNLASAHHLKTMMKAMAYDRMTAGAKTTAPTSLTTAPTRGVPPPPAPAAAVQQAQQAFEERATIRSGAALLAARRAAAGR